MNCIELEHAIDLAEKEDTNEEEAAVDHLLWCLPKNRKRNKNNAEIHNNDEYHDVGTDFSFIGLRGQDHAELGWMDWGQPDEPEKYRFTRKQKLLVNHYIWFRSAHPNHMWLHS